MLPIAVYQSTCLKLTHRHREQAPSHMWSQDNSGPTYRGCQPRAQTERDAVKNRWALNENPIRPMEIRRHGLHYDGLSEKRSRNPSHV